MLRPNFEIQIGDIKIDNSTNNLISLIIHQSMDIPSHSLHCYLRINEPLSKLVKGDQITIDLGYNNNLALIFKGFIDSTDLKASTILVVGLTSMLKLCNLRIDRFYEHQNAGYVVKDLAKVANVEVDTIENGIDLPYFAIDNNSNAYEHIKYLAVCSGYDFFGTNNEKLKFSENQFVVKHSISYGKDIIKIKHLETTDIFKTVTVVGESPSSFKGERTTHWLTKNVIQGKEEDFGYEGNFGYDLLIVDRNIRTTVTAAKLARSYLNRIRPKINLMIEITGNQNIMLGETIQIKDVPHKMTNGNYQVREIQHKLNKMDGFTTIIKCRGA